MSLHKYQYLKGLFILLTILLQSCAVLIPWLDNDPFYNFDAVQLQFPKRLPPVLSPQELTERSRSLKPNITKIPQYIIDNCPLVQLHSEEEYWPADVNEYVKHFHLTDTFNNTIPINGLDTKLSSLQSLRAVYLNTSIHSNQSGGDSDSDGISSRGLFLTSNEDFSKDPSWLHGYRPDYGTGRIKKGPAVLIVMDKGNGWVDAFWFYFYPFNLGPYIMGYGPWGNHIGDWEHSLVRFYMGEPKYLWMSAHAGGTAYKFEAIEKVKKLRRIDGELRNEVIYRPLIFSARGTHANYASAGQHWHDVPFFFMPLSDFTDRGPMWDPALNFYGYFYDGSTIRPSGEREERLGTDWLEYNGHWGDKQLPAGDPRQMWCPVQWKFIDGPTGPLNKNLGRISLCQEFKWWNFWGGCPARRWIKKGEGFEAEKNDYIGDNCGVLLYRIRPKWLRGIFRFLIWRGFTCFVMDYFTG